MVEVIQSKKGVINTKASRSISSETGKVNLVKLHVSVPFGQCTSVSVQREG